MSKKLILEKLRNYDGNDFPQTTNEKKVPQEYLEKLLRLTTKITERYATDILIDIDSMKKQLEESEEGCRYFGFRESGVDHDAFIESCSPIELKVRYIQIWKITWKPNENYKGDYIWNMYRLNSYVSEFGKEEYYTED